MALFETSKKLYETVILWQDEYVLLNNKSDKIEKLGRTKEEATEKLKELEKAYLLDKLL